MSETGNENVALPGLAGTGGPGGTQNLIEWLKYVKSHVNFLISL